MGETMVTWKKSAIVGIAWTNAGDAVACATEDGSAAARAGTGSSRTREVTKRKRRRWW